jgi:hypothetical protein
MVTRNAKGGRGAVAVLSGLLATALLGWSSGALAQPSSDRPAGYVVLPKILVHTTGGTPPVVAGGTATDTIVQITNTDRVNPHQVDCFWVNANNHCGTSKGRICDTNADCPLGQNCLPFWSVGDFGQITLTPGQPIGFTASEGLASIPCDANFPGPGCSGHCSATTGDICSIDKDCPAGETCTAQAAGSIPGVPENPFRGELKCVEVDANDRPIASNDLKEEATIVSTTIPVAAAPATTAASYNGVGFQAEIPVAGAPTNASTASDATLCLGSAPSAATVCAQTYKPCSNYLILDNFFEGASPEFGGVVSTDLTIAPCSEDLSDPSANANHSIALQFLVYNEFEQRTSFATRFDCFRETALANIDAAPGQTNFSIWAQGVEGTLTGQTLIRGVQGAAGPLGYGILGVAIESFSESAGGPVLATDAFNIHESSGFGSNGDAVILDVP